MADDEIHALPILFENTMSNKERDFCIIGLNSLNWLHVYEREDNFRVTHVRYTPKGGGQYDTTETPFYGRTLEQALRGALRYTAWQESQDIAEYVERAKSFFARQRV